MLARFLSSLVNSYMLNRVASSALLLIGLVLSASCEADYELGQGMALGDDFLVSGYSSVVLDAPRQRPKVLSIDDLSLFVSGHLNQWVNPFIEAEVSNLTLAREGDGPRSGGRFVLERFYNDTQLGAADTLRLGKILSPVGDWNLIHAAPLVPTITRPLTTQRGFAEYASGISWLHENPDGGRADWQFYWQPGAEWRQRPDSLAPRHYRDVWGAHANWSLGLSDKIGVSFQHGTLTATGGSFDLLGANARKTIGSLTLEGEAISSRRHGDVPPSSGREWGYYGLADYAFSVTWHGIVEMERYQDRLAVQESRNTLLGVAYKPQPAVVWKLEHVHQTGNSSEIPTGWLASFSVLF